MNRKIVLHEDSLDVLTDLARGEDPAVSDDRLHSIADTIEAQL